MENKKQILSERIKIRLTEEQRNLLITRAANAGTSVSAYMRSRLSAKDKLVPATHQENVLELRKEGARLKEIFEDLRQNGVSPELSREYDEALSKLTSLLERIAIVNRWW